MIGQRFVQLLEDHPWFEIGGLYASERSEGKRLREVMRVKDIRLKEDTLERRIEQLDAKAIAGRCRVAFSGLPTEIAKDTESTLAEAGVAVFSNAASHRMRDDVPLLIPEVNPEHLDLIKGQATYGKGGFIVTNANCSTTGLAVPMKALDVAYGLRFVCVSTYQAVSGAGYPGVPSLDILGNVVPHIRNEEEKMEIEMHKMLGKMTPNGVVNANFDMVASCARVPVIDGHTESVVLQMEKSPSVPEIIATLRAFQPAPQELQPSHRPHPGHHRPHGGRPAPAPLRRLRRRAGPGQRDGGLRRPGEAKRQIHQIVVDIAQHAPGRSGRFGDKRRAGQSERVSVR